MVHVERFDPLRSPVFTERVAFLKQTDSWSTEELESLQVQKLRYLVWYVHRNVPYYARILDKKGLTYDDFTKVEHVKRFPIINKRVVQDNWKEFLPRGSHPETMLTRSTGGSTGTPLTIYMDTDFLSRDKANTEYYMNVLGMSIFGRKSVRLYGDKIPPELIEKGEYWYLVENRKLVASCYHIARNTAGEYVKKLNAFCPEYIHTRPSSILPLARAILEQGLEVNPIAKIICDGEYLTRGQRRTIEEAFGGKIHNIYGHTEACTVGISCQESECLHFMPQVGIFELLDEKDKEVTREDARGQIVVTGFNNKMFPLIRYATGDIAVHTNKRCPCERNYRIIKEIEGRQQDYVVSKDNTVIPLAPAIFNYNDMDWQGIREFKVTQTKKGRLEVQIVLEERNAENKEEAKKYIRDKLEQILGGQFIVAVEVVKELPKTRIGKFRYLQQNITEMRIPQ